MSNAKRAGLLTIKTHTENCCLRQRTAAEREEILQRRRETRTAEAETRTAEVGTVQDTMLSQYILSVGDANVVAAMTKFQTRLSQIYSYAWPAV